MSHPVRYLMYISLGRFSWLVLWDFLVLFWPQLGLASSVSISSGSLSFSLVFVYREGPSIYSVILGYMDKFICETYLPAQSVSRPLLMSLADECAVMKGPLWWRFTFGVQFQKPYIHQHAFIRFANLHAFIRTCVFIRACPCVSVYLFSQPISRPL